jgi:hypothetical protein
MAGRIRTGASDWLCLYTVQCGIVRHPGADIKLACAAEPLAKAAIGNEGIGLPFLPEGRGGSVAGDEGDIITQRK